MTGQKVLGLRQHFANAAYAVSCGCIAFVARSAGTLTVTNTSADDRCRRALFLTVFATLQPAPIMPKDAQPLRTRF